MQARSHSSRPRGHRALTLAVTCSLSLAVTAGDAHAGAGFEMPSRQTTCGLLSASEAAGPSGLYCNSAFIARGRYDGRGAVRLARSGRARFVHHGNDLGLYIGGWGLDGSTDPRPTLSYGRRWRRSGYRCRSRTAGLICRRGTHGFQISRAKQRAW